MASKKDLYRLAPQGNDNISKNKRRPLAQGRVVTSNSGRSLPSEYSNDSSTTLMDDRGMSMSSSQHVSYQNVSPRLQMYSQIGSRMEDDSQTGTPRGKIHRSVHQESPYVSSYEKSLDVSDADSEIFFNTSKARTNSIKHSAVNTPHSVIVVDASRQTKSPDDTEIDVVLGLEHSPAKVICHSPKAVISDLRNTGDLASARRVQVDHLQGVTLFGNNDPGNPDKPRPPLKFKSPQVVRENARVTSSVVDHNTQVESYDVKGRHMSAPMMSSTINEYKQFTTPKNTVASSDPTKDEDDLAGIERLPPSNIGSELGSASESQRPPLTTTAKKKKPKPSGRVVQSRYMQASTTNKSISNKSTTRPQSRSMEVTTTRKSAKPPRPRAMSNYSETPMARGQAPAGRTTSTPATAYGKPLKVPTIDESAIMIENLSVISEPQSSIHNTTRQPQSLPHRTRTKPDVSHNATTTADKKPTNPQVTQHHLDLLYNRYLQSVFLDSKARKSFQEQEKQFMSYLYGLWEENSKLQQKKAELDLYYERLKHSNILDEALELQTTGLVGALSGLPKVQSDYTTMARALDTTRHSMPAKGIYIPTDEDEYQEKLVSALNESEQLLGELSIMVRSQEPKVTSFANAVSALEKTVDAEAKELERCKELMSAAQTLTTHETSLRIQSIQSE